MAVLFDTRGCTRGQVADKEMELQGAVSPLLGSSTLAQGRPRDSLTYFRVESRAPNPSLPWFLKAL